MDNTAGNLQRVQYYLLLYPDFSTSLIHTGRPQRGVDLDLIPADIIAQSRVDVLENVCSDHLLLLTTVDLRKVKREVGDCEGKFVCFLKFNG